MSWLGDTFKGVLCTVGGTVLCATGVGAVVGAPLLAAGVYTAGKA